MNKSSKLPDAILPVKVTAPVTPALPTKRPYAIQLTDAVDVVLQKAAVLIRHHGYVPCAQTPTSVFGMTGMMTITLVQGSIDQTFVPAAEAEIVQAAELESIRYQRDVEQAAVRQLQAKADAEAAIKRAQLLAVQKAQLAELEQQIKALAAATTV